MRKIASMLSGVVMIIGVGLLLNGIFLASIEPDGESDIATRSTGLALILLGSATAFNWLVNFCCRSSRP